MKTYIATFFLTGSFFADRFLQDGSEDIVVGLYCLSLSFFSVIAFVTSSQLRARRCKLGPFNPHVYFCAGVVLLFVILVGLSFEIIATSRNETRVIVTVLQIVNLMALTVAFYVKKYFKEVREKNTTYL